MSTLLDRNKTLDADDIARGVARLDDETILQSLRDRYFVSAIYSSVNSMLIAINPYEELGLYTQAKLEEYATLGGDTVPAPHAFGIAAAAFKGLLAGGSQSIVITGESGAGKTETAKRMLQFLAHMAGAHAPDPSLTALPPPSLDSKSPAALHLLLLRTNAVLEAFGNAHTTMNDNSSRFGKFLSVQYDASAKLLGAQLNTYLLEKTRCTARGPGECTFHVLYMLLLGTPPSEAGQLELKPDFQAYRTTRVQAASARQLAALVDPSGRDGASWSAQLAEVRSVLTDAIGLGSADVWSLLQLLGCVVHCGSVDFATPASGQTSTGAALNDGALRPLRALARLLGVDASKLCDALTTRVIRAGTEFVAKPNTHAEASALCDALGKALYARVFDDVVRSINGAVGLSRPGAPTRGTPAHAFIGILDIFGFERFERNSLEQLLINFTNEHLQSLFNRIVFTAAQAEAAHEGVDTSAFGESQVDNREVLHLFGAERYGLIASLNEECIFPKGTDESFVAKLRHANGRNPRLVDDSSNARADPKRTFSVRHFAGDVLYAADGFLLKNKDPFSEDLAALLRASAEPTVARLFAPPTAEKSAAVRSGAFQKLVFKGVAVQFEAQLQRLLRVLAAGNVHFVRCVKPNNDKKPRAFDDARVLDQLRCGGVTEAIRVFAAGFPDRVPFDAFCARYGPLVAEGAREARPPSAEAARALLGALGVAAGEFALGSSKVFCKGGLIQRLELRREQLLKVHAVRCQAAIRGMLARSRARALRAAAREHAARRQRAEDSERRLREMEEAAEVERAREREAALAAHAAGRAAAADAARAAADSAAAARAHEAHAAAELIASKRRAAELEVELTSARAQLGASGATPTPAADSAVRGASAEAEVVELRLQLARALAQLQREKEDGASYRAEAEGTNARWQGEARRCDAELKRQLEQREAERRVHADRADELRWELAFWKGEMELHWLRDVDTRRKPKEADKAGRGLGGFVVDAFKSVAQQLGAKASLASKPAAAAAERAGQARAPDPLREVNPTCRQPSAAEALEPAGSTQRLVVSATSVSKAAVRAAGAGVVRAARYQPETYGGRWSVEVLEFAEYMGLDPVQEEALMWIAEDLSNAPLPPGWAVQRDPRGGRYFFNEVTGESMQKHPTDLQYKQLVNEHRLERAMTGAPPPPAASFGTSTIRSMFDSLFVLPGAETLVSARLAVPDPRELLGSSVGGAGGSSAGALVSLLPQYVLHTLLSAPLVPNRRAESLPILWASCMQQDSSTTLFSLAREAEGVEFAFIVARKGCARSTLYVQDESAPAGSEKEMSAIIIREPFAGSAVVTVDLVLPMPRADGKAVGISVSRRADALLAQYEAGQKSSLVVLCGQLKADARALEASLSLPTRAGAAVGARPQAPLMELKQSAMGGADMELRYGDRISPVQAMHVVLALNRWWSMRHAARRG